MRTLENMAPSSEQSQTLVGLFGMVCLAFGLIAPGTHFSLVLDVRLHAPKVAQLRVHVFEFLLGHRARLAAVCAVLQPQEAGNLVETEPQTLGRFHELNACHV
jgi:hypothetical protein